jgi:hypothetical protein
MIDQAAVIALAVSVFVSVVTSLVTLTVSKRQIKAELDELRQTQLTEIVKRRIEVYPQIWSVILNYVINWQLEKKTRDKIWAKDFLSDLNKCNAENGIFFSESVYKKFYEFISALVKLEAKLSSDVDVTVEELKVLDDIFIGKAGSPGLATYLKDDLGSYQSVVLQRLL